MNFDELVNSFLDKYGFMPEEVSNGKYIVGEIDLELESHSDVIVLYSNLFSISDLSAQKNSYNISKKNDFIEKISSMQSLRMKDDVCTSISISNDKLIIYSIISINNLSPFFFEKFVEKFINTRDFWLDFIKDISGEASL